MGDIRSVWYYHTGGLLELLMISRLFDAKDPKDKVYSVLGLAQTPVYKSQAETPKSPTDSPSLGMIIDYSATVSEVYQYIAKYTINRDRTLDILCILPTHQDHNSGDLPTWTPDWRVPVSKIPLLANWEYFNYKWAAAGFTRCLPQDQLDLGCLTVEGFPVARILQLLPLTPTSIPHPPETPAGDLGEFDPDKHLRRFAVTDRKAAIVPSAADVGDVIFVLYGCKMPIALRWIGFRDDHLEAIVVGPCFLAELMHGEALRDLDENVKAGKTMKTRIRLV